MSGIDESRREELGMEQRLQRGRREPFAKEQAFEGSPESQAWNPIFLGAAAFFRFTDQQTSHFRRQPVAQKPGYIGYQGLGIQRGTGLYQLNSGLTRRLNRQMTRLLDPGLKDQSSRDGSRRLPVAFPIKCPPTDHQAPAIPCYRMRCDKSFCTNRRRVSAWSRIEAPADSIHQPIEIYLHTGDFRSPQKECGKKRSCDNRGNSRHLLWKNASRECAGTTTAHEELGTAHG
jgi:hypothetical protein